MLCLGRCIVSYQVLAEFLSCYGPRQFTTVQLALCSTKPCKLSCSVSYKHNHDSRSKGAGQGRAGQGRAGQGRAGQGRAGQGRAGQGRAGQGHGRAGQGHGRVEGGTVAGQGKYRTCPELNLTCNLPPGRAVQGRSQSRAGQILEQAARR